MKQLVMVRILFFSILTMLTGLISSSCHEKTHEKISEHTISTQVKIGDSLYITKVYLDQQKIINAYKNKKDTTQLRIAIDSLYKEYYSAWNDCFMYPKEDLYKLHLNYAESSSELVETRSEAFEKENVDSLATSLVAKVKDLSEYEPKGNHYLMFMLDSDDFEMGGCSNDLMYVNMNRADFSMNRFKKVFPHELNHQIYEKTLKDADYDLVLWSIIDEGFASFFEKLVNNGSVAEALNLTQEEYEWCLANEKRILEKTLPLLFSTRKEDELSLRNKNALLEGSPGQLNYFIGYRIIEHYLEKHGDDSWRDIYTTPVREVLKESAYLNILSSEK